MSGYYQDLGIPSYKEAILCLGTEIGVDNVGLSVNIWLSKTKHVVCNIRAYIAT